MIDKKISNNELASKAGVSLNIITRLKRDQYIAMDTIEKICMALDCTVDEILEFTADEQWTIQMQAFRIKWFVLNYIMIFS